MSRSFEMGGAPHFPPHSTVSRVMLQVIYALVPAIAAHAWFFGPGILIQIVLAAGFAIGFEALMLKIRKQPTRLFLGDFSAVLTAILFALCIPPLAPWWIALVGMLFSIVVAKHLYGGLGQQPVQSGNGGLRRCPDQFSAGHDCLAAPFPDRDGLPGAGRCA